jgi:hypothetical protein
VLSGAKRANLPGAARDEGGFRLCHALSMAAKITKALICQYVGVS